MSTNSPKKRPLEEINDDNSPKAKKQKTQNSAPVLYVQKLSEDAQTPTKGSKMAAGYDLFSAKEETVAAHGKALIKTDIAIQLPEGCYGRIGMLHKENPSFITQKKKKKLAPRSGLAWKNHIATGGGVIDGDYRGNVGVILFNHSDEPFKVAKGTRIAQLILEKYVHDSVVKVVDSLNESARGENGFGSTGTDSTITLHDKKRE
ncbi:hypothetical protein RFI_10180 [Reticulomyxa filosa]|uniref:Deoxyuridine 5'-triphosphate nucleotidohydrolase n=1 Tax=Reticulomyxa filosa TaxID=46433 RepID=X6NMP6_RETFI|nr:hypothetical protein RFI_10180 [Reticulomyxa filosa]|eukprot:ETO26954.1 hypothetical protein RFI_10180 [Reticulomyxa filosa]